MRSQASAFIRYTFPLEALSRRGLTVLDLFEDPNKIGAALLKLQQVSRRERRQYGFRLVSQVKDYDPAVGGMRLASDQTRFLKTFREFDCGVLSNKQVSRQLAD